MKHYQPKNYRLPQDVYLRAIYSIKALPRLYAEVNDFIHEQPRSEVPAKTNKPSAPVAAIAERREKKLKQIDAVEEAFRQIPEEYRDAIKANIIDEVPRSNFIGIAPRTISRWRAVVVLEVAKNTELIDLAEYEKIKKKCDL